MNLVETLFVWVLASAPAMSASQVPPSHPHSLLWSRMDRLESLVFDYQDVLRRQTDQWETEKQILRHERDQWEKEKQNLRHERNQWEKEKQILQRERDQWVKATQILQRERDQWEKEKHILQREHDQWKEERHILVESLQSPQGDAHTLQTKKDIGKQRDGLQNTRTLTHTLAAKNQGVNSRLRDLQHQLDSMDSRLQSLQDQMIRCEEKAGSYVASDEEVGEEDESALGELSGQADHTADHRNNWQPVTDSRARHLKDSSVVRQGNNLDSFRQNTLTLRSDDGGPMEVVVNHLAQQNAQLQAEVQALRTSDAQQQRDIQAAAGSTFVHWGSSTCAGSSQLVYSGAVGGSLYSHTGAAANTLCLSLAPRLVDSKPVASSLLYGAEYETHDSHQDTDPVCAVCRSALPTTIMVPGTDVCSSGWTLQYSGYLMAGDYGDTAATEYICVDSKLESAVGNKDNHNGHVLYYTKAQCGSLPCPPYENDKTVTCVVCSK